MPGCCRFQSSLSYSWTGCLELLLPFCPSFTSFLPPPPTCSTVQHPFSLSTSLPLSLPSHPIHFSLLGPVLPRPAQCCGVNLLEPRLTSLLLVQDLLKGLKIKRTSHTQQCGCERTIFAKLLCIFTAKRGETSCSEVLKSEPQIPVWSYSNHYQLTRG